MPDTHHPYLFPERYQEKIEAALRERGSSLAEHKRIAECVLKLSDHYQERTSITPWSRPEFQIAYLAYFFPLNYIRNLKTYTEIQRVNFAGDFSRFIDFGCGLGSSLLAAYDSGVLPPSTAVHGLDSFALPLEILTRHFLPHGARFSPQTPGAFRSAFGVFSYSLNELSTPPSWLYELDHVLILEPSTQLHARKLMELRKNLLAKGFHLWAPCTHHEECPLLLHSSAIGVMIAFTGNNRSGFANIERHLPIKTKL